jgi:hypothetical protein
MSKRQSFTLGTETFVTKSAADKRIAGVLAKYAPGAVLDDADEAFVRAVLANHQSAAEKIGVGVDHLEVMRSDFGNRCFCIVRVDGSRIDFSYKSCLTPRSALDDFKKACRTSVVDSVLAFKSMAFALSGSLTCPITGEVVTWDTCHVDHAEPWTFDAILAAFIAEYGSTASVDAAGGTTTRFLNEPDALMFRAYHDARASLRVVSRTANLSTLRKGR